MPERALGEPVDRAGEAVEDERGGQVAEPERRRAEHSAVQRAVTDPPLRQGDPDDRAEGRVGQRQQDGDRQFPHRVHVPGDAGLFPRPPGEFHAAHLARDQQAEQGEVTQAAEGRAGQRPRATPRGGSAIAAPSAMTTTAMKPISHRGSLQTGHARTPPVAGTGGLNGAPRWEHRRGVLPHGGHDRAAHGGQDASTLLDGIRLWEGSATERASDVPHCHDERCTLSSKRHR